MLRQVLGVKRRVFVDQSGERITESWQDWMMRSADEVHQAMATYNVPEWVDEAFRRKFRWAGHVARRFDG
eukprot:7532458-Karenia_brevis.AAC.1